MELTTLGRTGLDVSVAGLGCGGHSRLGLTNGASEDDAIAVVHRALYVAGAGEAVGPAMISQMDEFTTSARLARSSPRATALLADASR